MLLGHIPDSRYATGIGNRANVLDKPLSWMDMRALWDRDGVGSQMTIEPPALRTCILFDTSQKIGRASLAETYW
jgi:hypothetical protein